VECKGFVAMWEVVFLIQIESSNMHEEV